MYKDLPKIRGEYRFDYNISKSTWFNVGGNVDVLFRPEDEDDLAFFLKNRPEEIPYIVLGVCSNVIVRDGGYRGVLIKLGRNFTDISHDKNIINVGCGALDSNVARYAAENNIAGLEFLIGIPGTIGGNIAMNAGAYGTEVKDVLVEATAITKTGMKKTYTNESLNFEYRKAHFEEGTIFTSCILKGHNGIAEDIKKKMQNISSSREETQPVRTKTGGSTFKNPKNSEKKAWQLIDEAGLRGYKIGGAQISEKHCNFLINT
ncbi:MAG TPA: UDP-N-acetylenolpyruvoylglucosamine reductase, partial [Alphaproteobacteria bacterium]|nr:UDP-N-acetylenolpyruvoylglucosamine reductase [Alphaproteobacteria bacterium]